MPVSKKPRSKAGAPAALPDRRAMESFLAAIAGHRGDDATAKAQDVMYDAWERTTSRLPLPDSASPAKHSASRRSALTLMSFWPKKPRSIEEARDLYAKGVEAGELALGPRGFKEYAGHFWGFLEICPYMRARAGLASTLLQLGDVDGALAHYYDMLKLNPNDNQGIIPRVEVAADMKLGEAAYPCPLPSSLRRLGRNRLGLDGRCGTLGACRREYRAPRLGWRSRRGGQP